MPIATIIIAALVILFGFRLLTIAIRSAFSGHVLVRQGMRREWQPAPSKETVWKTAIRDGLMGIMLIVLGVFLMT